MLGLDSAFNQVYCVFCAWCLSEHHRLFYNAGFFDQRSLFVHLVRFVYGICKQMICCIISISSLKVTTQSKFMGLPKEGMMVGIQLKPERCLLTVADIENMLSPMLSKQKEKNGMGR